MTEDQPTEEFEAAVTTQVEEPRIVDAKQPPQHSKMTVAAFILGIVGTSLAVIALIVAIAGFGHGRDSGRLYDRGIDHGPGGSVTLEENFVEREGGSRRHNDTHGFTERLDQQMSGNDRPGHGWRFDERIEEEAPAS